MMENKVIQVLEILNNANHVTVFTGAGVSVESGIPPFRGETGLWSKYDPEFLELDYFYTNPLKSWKVIKEIFYDFFGQAKPNNAHIAIAKLEAKGIVKAVITQNIDNLHQEAGSNVVYEFHGNSHSLKCIKCNTIFKLNEVNIEILPPKCLKCEGILKPDFIFFGEGIPPIAYENSMIEAELADVFIVVGTTGEIMPACMIPQIAKRNGVKIIEINPEKSLYTNTITDIHLQGKAGEVMLDLYNNLK